MTTSHPKSSKQLTNGDVTRQKHRPWRPGESGNPNGRPVGSRNKFAAQYIDDYYQVWQREGIKALEACARKKPDKFIMVAAHLIPQHFKVEHEHKLTMLSDEELRRKMLEAKAELERAGITIDLEAMEVSALPAFRKDHA